MLLGDYGEEVRQWQAKLISLGYSLDPYGDDGDFGILTEQRTFQATGKFEVEGDECVRPVKLKWKASRHFTKAQRSIIPLIVVHTAEVAEGSTSAEAVANFFATTDKKVSAHVCIDDDSIVECVRPKDVAYTAPEANRHGYHYELSGYARQTAEGWEDDFSKAMLKQFVWHSSMHAMRYRVPIRLLTEELLADFLRSPLTEPGGFTEHRIVSNVLRNHKHFGLPAPKKISTHWDPGFHFPWDSILSDIHDLIVAL